MNELFIEVGGLVIKINFDTIHTLAPNILSLRNKSEIEIFSYLKNFVIFKKINKYDFEILVSDFPTEEKIRINNSSKEYVPILERLTPKKIKTYYQNSIQQFEIVLKSAIYSLLESHNGFAIHSSAIKKGKFAYIFLGDSGAGKSTIASYLDSKYPVLSDDVTFIRKYKSKYYVFQTPILEKSWWMNKDSKIYELKKIFFLIKSKEFKTVKITDIEKINEGMLKQVNLTNSMNTKMIKEAMIFTKKFANFYNLYFGKDERKTIQLINTLKP